MNAALLLEMLSRIANSSTRGDPMTLLNYVMAAQDLVLQMQRDHMAVLHENSTLRDRLERCEGTTIRMAGRPSL